MTPTDQSAEQVKFELTSQQLNNSQYQHGQKEVKIPKAMNRTSTWSKLQIQG